MRQLICSDGTQLNVQDCPERHGHKIEWMYKICGKLAIYNNYAINDYIDKKL